MRLAALAAAIAITTVPAVAIAQPALVGSTPAADGTVAKPTAIALSFSEEIVGAASGFDLVMTGMPGMANHKPMPIKGMETKAKGKTLAATLPRPLPSGTYKLTWHAAGADRKQAQGAYNFTVR